MTILHNVQDLGQSIWLDNLSRSLIQRGELAQWLEEGVGGVTSNPAIFQKAFAGDALYQDEIADLKTLNLSAHERYERLAIADMQAACDVCLPLYETNPERGLVSLEVAPEWAHDAEGTIAEARRLWAAINRPNAMIKVPATDAGLSALSALVADGINVNLTLLFSRNQTLKAYAAYTEGLLTRLEHGQEVTGIQVVASFFISRIDAALDTTLPEHLQGKVAISLAKMAYDDWHTYFKGMDFILLREKGAAPVRLLWASTGVKNPAYKDTLYVDSLIGKATVNTVPEPTLKAFLNHGRAKAHLTDHTGQAKQVLADAAEQGVDLEALASRLLDDGLKQFEEAFAALLAALT